VTRDFSTEGVYFETDQAFSAGQAIMFSILMEHSCIRLRCHGEVLRVERIGEKRGVAVAIHSCSIKEA
jgi:hypothetical protein